jgi:hypothetical protein
VLLTMATTDVNTCNGHGQRKRALAQAAPPAQNPLSVRRNWRVPMPDDETACTLEPRTAASFACFGPPEVIIDLAALGLITFSRGFRRCGPLLSLCHQNKPAKQQEVL